MEKLYSKINPVERIDWRLLPFDIKYKLSKLTEEFQYRFNNDAILCEDSGPPCIIYCLNNKGSSKCIKFTNVCVNGFWGSLPILFQRTNVLTMGYDNRNYSKQIYEVKYSITIDDFCIIECYLFLHQWPKELIFNVNSFSELQSRAKLLLAHPNLHVKKIASSIVNNEFKDLTTFYFYSERTPHRLEKEHQH